MYGPMCEPLLGLPVSLPKRAPLLAHAQVNHEVGALACLPW